MTSEGARRTPENVARRGIPLVLGLAALAHLLLGSGSSWASARGLAAQATDEPPGRPVSSAAHTTTSDADARCLELFWPGQPSVPAGRRLASESCRVTEAGPLVRLGSGRWYWALYRHEFAYEPDPAVEPEPAAERDPAAVGEPGIEAADLRFLSDTVHEDELVLFVEAVEGTATGAADDPANEPEADRTQGGAATVLRAVWHDRSDTRFEFLEPPRVAALPSRAGPGALLAHRRCLDGTGGCVDHPYRLGADGSVEALRPLHIVQLEERLPEAWGTWKGVWLEPEGLRAEAAVYVPRDANCCPSFRALARVAVAGESLVLDSLALHPEAGGFAWEVVPGRSWGHVDAETSEVELEHRYGPGVVARGEVYLAEGICTPGTRVFPGAPWEVEIAWADSARTRPAFARATGSEAPWHTPAGVRLGATLEELERIRGEPLRFSGFGWDYGGRLRWEEGDGGLRLLVGPDSASNRRLHGDLRDDARSDELFGERSVRSDHPLVRALVIRAERMTLGWEEPAIQRDCAAR